MVQGILFWGYSTPNFVNHYLKDCYDITSFTANSYSFRRIGLKLNRQLDHVVVQNKLFRGYSILKFDRGITILIFPTLYFLQFSLNEVEET